MSDEQKINEWVAAQARRITALWLVEEVIESTSEKLKRRNHRG